MRRIVGIAPHADDVELGLGGYIDSVVRSKEPVKVDVYVMAAGSASHTKEGSEISTSQRQQEARAAADFLGYNVHFLEAAEDGAFNAVPQKQLVAAVEDALFAGDPVDELYIPLPSFHSDHTLTHQACISALRPRLVNAIPRAVYAYEYPGHHWGPAPPALGKVYRKITPINLACKIRALECYKTQWVSTQTAPGLGTDAVRHLAALRGSECATDLAELFYLVREIAA